jgi:hypothetical protein
MSGAATGRRRWMPSRTLRIACAIVLAVLGAFWFEVDFSSSHQIAPSAAVAQAAEAGAATSPSHPLPSLSAVGSALTGGVVTALPPWGVLAIVSVYLLGRLSYKRRSISR